MIRRKLTDAEIARARRIVRESTAPASPPRRRSSGKIVRYLEATGWTRSPAEVVEECEAETEISICHHPARWHKDGLWLCAQHAYRAERYGS